MLPDCYFGAYARFNTTSKKDAAILLGSNCIIGDVFNIEFKPLEGQTRAWVVNDYGDTLGYLDEQTSHKLNLLAAKNWEMHAVLSFVALGRSRNLLLRQGTSIGFRYFYANDHEIACTRHTPAYRRQESRCAIDS